MGLCTRYAETAVFPLLVVALLHLIFPGGIVESHFYVTNLLCGLMFFYLLRQVLTSSCRDGVKAIGKHFVVMVPCFNVVAFLFGAHPISQCWDTLTWSILLSLLLMLPSVSLLETTGTELWSRLLLQSFHHCKEQAAGVICVTTLLGAWCGAFPILLDWNRPWQVWPIPSCIGALVGNAVGSMVGAMLIVRAEVSATSRKSA